MYKISLILNVAICSPARVRAGMQASRISRFVLDLVGEEKRLTFSQNEITWTCFQLALSSTYP